MKLEQEILINKYGQDLVHIEKIIDIFENLGVDEKRHLLNDIVYLIIQSKAIDTDIYQAIISSGLKETYTPCILLKKGVSNYNLQKIIGLPEMELAKGFRLLLSLFKIAYKRRFLEEKENPNKWWYWDLSNTNNIEILMNKNQ